MSNHRQEIIENFSKYRIELDDVFAFKCRNCGKCCKNREDILLNSRDVYNIAKAFNLSTRQVVEKYCETYIGRDSRIPIVRLKPRRTNKSCPLLAGNRCSVHSLKPSICALFPLGRIIVYESALEHGGFDTELFRPNEIQYIINQSKCGSLKKKQTVRAWLEMFGIPVDDDFFVKWNHAVFSISTATHNIEKTTVGTSNALDMLWSGILLALYADYDTQKDFYAQFDHNVSKILRVLEGIEQIL